jgi:hypothetical protein
MSGSLFVTPRFRPVNSSGTPLAGATLTFHSAGTSNLETIYADSDLTTPLSNPITADSGGEFRAIYLDSSLLYRITLKASSGVQIWSDDFVPAIGTGSGSGGTGGTGTPGLSVAELAIYQRAASAPSTPAGGEFSFASQTLTPPSGWTSDVPDGYDPVWTSRAVAAVSGATGTDTSLAWSAPVRFTADGSMVNIVFRRNAGQPATPAPSASVPASWYDDVASVPVSADTLWSSVGTRANAGENWIWQLPIQVEGDAGPAGTAAEQYYILPTSGTAIRNGAGSLQAVLRKLVGGSDTAVTTGTVQIYSGSTLCNVANGFAAGSDGYTVNLDAGDISNSIVLTAKDGVGGSVLDSLTLVDIADGSTGAIAAAVYGFIESPFLAWTRASDGTTFTPAASTCKLDATFIQNAADVARIAYTLTRDSGGLITGATSTHTGGDLNTGRITISTSGSGTTNFTVKFSYSYTGDVCKIAETVYCSLAGVGGTGATGPSGVSPLTIGMSTRSIPLQAYQDGSVVSYAAANGQMTVYSGTTDVTASATINAISLNGCTATCNTALNTPVTGAKGYFAVTSLPGSSGSFTVSATYGGATATETVSVYKSNVGYELVASLPVTNLFIGRQVVLTTDEKRYIYRTGGWTRAVDGADITPSSVTTDDMFASNVYTAKLRVTQLSVLSADMGTVTAGTVQSAGGGLITNYNTAQILFDTAPGQAGVGYVRLQGYGFGPSSNYLDWYGPKPAGQSSLSGIISGLTDSAALYFLKTTGASQSVARGRSELEIKAWANFRGMTAGALAAQTIRDCYNIATITRDGAGTAGQFIVTFSQALANTNYLVIGNANATAAGDNPNFFGAAALATTGFNCNSRNRSGANNNCELIWFAVFGSSSATSNVVTPSGGYGGGTRGLGNLPNPF